MSAQSCDQLWDIYTDHQSTDDQSVPPVSVHQCQLCAHPCHLPVPISATFQCPSMPHISAHLSCLSVSPVSASQCHLSVPVSAAYQCRLTVPVSAAY
ncbi:unnamed protein product [Staurois parvus]|uniref:Uncharacterized protein n=1 Tax=Staurois parvus TaxID=386267 RepID=A0ABN9BHF5_9NEOB|nr:unnamed protein product [Staurois parvus]